MEQSTYREQQLKKLDDLIKNIRIAMLITSDRQGALHSRPLVTKQIKFDGHLWSIVRRDTTLMEELQDHPQVNISFADPEHGQYVSISGTAVLVNDLGDTAEHWHTRLCTWFPHGLAEPEPAVLQIQVDNAEYWDVTSSAMTRFPDVAMTPVGGQASAPAEHSKLVVDERQTGP
jgi:general stress protein 26